MGDEMTERFLADGFVRIPGAFDEATARAGAELLWRECGFDRDDPATWTAPVVRLGDMAQPPFAQAANTPVLHAAYDRLVGAGRWRPRRSLGTFPLRFPHPEEPLDTGWHIEGSYLPEGARWYHANWRSRERALLMLFLFSEVGEDDAPTVVRVGSHLDVPPLLRGHGEPGASILAIGAEVAEASAHREEAYVTGRPGDVYLCHPFLVHRAQRHTGTRPRFMAQPPLHPVGPCLVEHEDRVPQRCPPVERAIRDALGLPVG
ncbi:phytanoyl-CoA dioxygenase family protein [Streptantibioticus parmotrematis]|uniref:phytanoyl-CoA dioxygenase family protein n=1 Tax=Streptantibioticus parmotrematis TaxID=2873249 RepID=UPI0033E210E4